MPALKKDFDFILAKLNDVGLEVPGWTGFNIKLLGGDEAPEVGNSLPACN